MPIFKDLKLFSCLTLLLGMLFLKCKKNSVIVLLIFRHSSKRDIKKLNIFSKLPPTFVSSTSYQLGDF